jgi:hypothetical protein
VEADYYVVLIYVRNTGASPATFTAVYGPTQIEGEVAPGEVKVFEAKWYLFSRLIVTNPVEALVVVQMLQGLKSTLTPPPPLPAAGPDEVVAMQREVGGRVVARELVARTELMALSELMAMVAAVGRGQGAAATLGEDRSVEAAEPGPTAETLGALLERAVATGSPEAIARAIVDEAQRRRERARLPRLDEEGVNGLAEALERAAAAVRSVGAAQ